MANTPDPSLSGADNATSNQKTKQGRPDKSGRLLRSYVRDRQLHRLLMAGIEPGSAALDLIQGRVGKDPSGYGSGGKTCGLADLPLLDRPDPDGPGSSSIACGVLGNSTKLLGLNHVKEYRRRVTPTGKVVDSTKYGDHGEPLADAARLGADKVRQVGGRDLLWSFLLERDDDEILVSSDLTLGRPLPVLADPPSSSDINWEARAVELSELLRLAENADVELAFTFFSKGGLNIQQAPPGPNTSGSLGEGVDFFHQWNGSSLSAPVVRLDWSGGHIGQVDNEVIPNNFPVREFAHLRTISPQMSRVDMSTLDMSTLYETSWHMDTLDVSAPYKRSYMQYLGQIAGRVLNRAADEVDRGFDLPTRVDSIGLFNEVSVDNKYFASHGTGSYDAESTGEMWGRACARAAYGIRTELSDPAVKLVLPGLLSYNSAVESTSPHSWTSRMRYLRSLVRFFVRELFEKIDLEFSCPSKFPDYLQAIDLHWYHHQDGETLHIGFMVHEVDDVFEAVQEGLIEGLDEAYIGRFITESQVDEYSAAVMASFDIRISETGCSALENGKTYLPLGFSSPAQFQAFEVWRRLGGALASRASTASWHSWMSDQDVDYAGFGLREDTQQENAAASVAVPRESWFAYQRLAEQLGRVITGQMLLPDTSDRDDMMSRFGSPRVQGDDHPIVVFEYELASVELYRWAYLVLFDPPARVIPPLANGIGVFPEWTDRSSGTAIQVPIEPDGPPEGSDGSTGALPIYNASYGRDEVFSVGRFTLGIRRGDMPVLIKSSARISWTPISLALGPLAPTKSSGTNESGTYEPKYSPPKREPVTEQTTQPMGPTPSVLRALWIDLPAWLEDPTVPVGKV